MIRTGQDVIAEFTDSATTSNRSNDSPDRAGRDRRLHRRAGSTRCILSTRVRQHADPGTGSRSRLLPIVQPESDRRVSATTSSSQVRRRCWSNLLPRFVEMQVYQAVARVDRVGAFGAHGRDAQRDSTTRKISVRELTLTYNKARQAQITREVSEISAGAAAAEK